MIYISQDSPYQPIFCPIHHVTLSVWTCPAENGVPQTYFVVKVFKFVHRRCKEIHQIKSALVAVGSRQSQAKCPKSNDPENTRGRILFPNTLQYWELFCDSAYYCCGCHLIQDDHTNRSSYCKEIIYLAFLQSRIPYFMLSIVDWLWFGVVIPTGRQS